MLLPEFSTREGLLDVIGGKVPVFDGVGTNILKIYSLQLKIETSRR